jgi:hypothetical protein
MAAWVRLSAPILPKDVPDMAGGGVLTEEQLLSDLPVAGSGAEAPQHVDLPGGQPVGTGVRTPPFAMGREHAGVARGQDE